MKIYTRTGDRGETGLIGGARVAKSDPRLEACGTVDELNALLGLAAVTSDPPIRDRILLIQARLFDVGALLATPPDVSPVESVERFDLAWLTELEADIDAMVETIPQLRSFILPGGSETSARLHLARTLCRRAERRIVAMPQDALWDGEAIVTWINRLSDWIFVAARFVNHQHGVADVLWHATTTGSSTD